MSFPSLPKLTLRLEVPLWTDLSEARDPPPHMNPSESDADSSRRPFTRNRRRWEGQMTWSNPVELPLP